jgi:predicted DNA-binding protein with PD1-like motif
MKSKLIHDAPQRTFAVVFDQGDEVLENLLAFAKARDISAAGRRRITSGLRSTSRSRCWR